MYALSIKFVSFILFPKMYYLVDLLEVTIYFYWGLEEHRNINWIFQTKKTKVHLINIELDNRDCNAKYIMCDHIELM